jgi:putative transposase
VSRSGDDARSTSKSAVSRTFVQRTPGPVVEADEPAAWGSAPGGDDARRGRAARPYEHRRVGITTAGDKLALGLWEGSTENAAVAGALLADLVDRGLDVEQGLLFVIDGSKALRKAIRQVFGHEVAVQRCVRHKERNVLEHLPERDRDTVKLRLRQAWQDADHEIALEQLNTLALELDKAHPGAPNSLREGMVETLTLTRLGITGKLKRTLQSTNPASR